MHVRIEQADVPRCKTFVPLRVQEFDSIRSVRTTMYRALEHALGHRPLLGICKDKLMLIWESSSVKRKEIEAFAAHARGAAECLLREDNKGSLILCEQGKAPKGVDEKRLTPLFSAGRFLPHPGQWPFPFRI